MNDHPIATKIIRASVQQLGKTQRGIDALFYMRLWISDTCMTLTGRDQASVLMILQALWGTYPECAITEIDATLMKKCCPEMVKEILENLKKEENGSPEFSDN